jgi:type IV pilus assembly protein PilC
LLILRKQSIIVRHISKSYEFSRRIPSAEITRFSRSLAALVKAGIPLSQSLEMTRQNTGNQKLARIIQVIKTETESGILPSQTLQKYPHQFNHFFCSMVSAGEQTGTLDIMLDKIATHREGIENVRRTIREALAYPATVVLIALAITLGMLTFVVPQFESLFRSFHAELPRLTRMVIAMSEWIKTWGLALIICFAIVVMTIVAATKQSARFTAIIHRVIPCLPLAGKLLQKTIVIKFGRTLSLTLACGLPLTEGLKLAENVVENQHYIKAIQTIHDEISQGISMHQAMKSANIFPDMVIQLVTIGEETGALTDMLEKMADYYENEVNLVLETLSSLLEPAIMTILGLMIGCLVVAMYLPIFKIGSAL